MTALTRRRAANSRDTCSFPLGRSCQNTPARARAGSEPAVPGKCGTEAARVAAVTAAVAAEAERAGKGGAGPEPAARGVSFGRPAPTSSFLSARLAAGLLLGT